MISTDYSQLSDIALLELCIWREARGEPWDAKCGVAWVVANRIAHPGWWGTNVHSVVLKSWQFSSFNANDPNAEKWPEDADPSFAECCRAAQAIMTGSYADVTDGATHYYDVSISFPHGWGDPSNWVNTANLGRLKFYKQRQP